MNQISELLAELPAIPPKQIAYFDSLVEESMQELHTLRFDFYKPPISRLSVNKNYILPLADIDKINFILYCIRRVYAESDTRQQAMNSRSDQIDQFSFYRTRLCFAYIGQLFKTTSTFSEGDVMKIMLNLFGVDYWRDINFADWHLIELIKKLEVQYEQHPVSEGIELSMDILKRHIDQWQYRIQEKDKGRILSRMEQLLFTNVGEVKPTLFLTDDLFGNYANEQLEALPSSDRIIWYLLMQKVQRMSSSTPTAKFYSESKSIIEKLGENKFITLTHIWFRHLIQLKEQVTTTTHNYNGILFNQHKIEFVHAFNTDVIRGFVFISALFPTSENLQQLARLAERCFKKIPNKGAAAPSIGNACLFALFKSGSLEGIGHLSRLQLKVKQTNAQTLIKKYLDQAATGMGMDRHAIEDLSVSDYGLADGSRRFSHETFTATLEILQPGKSVLRWYNENGKEQKSVPIKAVQEHSILIKEIKQTQKLVDQATIAQRDRIDRLLRSNRVMTMEYFTDHYLNHGLLSFITKKIIWIFKNEVFQEEVIYQDGQWISVEGIIIEPSNFKEAMLWHPVKSWAREVKKWRQYLIDREIRQPIKQAFREIYIVTEAEANTSTYSNRMAAHVLKQHQYVMLAKTRGWNAKLIGAWDGGDKDTGSLVLPEYGLIAEYWVNAVDTEGEYTDSGIWKYVATDQVRFINGHNFEVVPLVDIPPVIFSEVMRDVDLFVGVASVGNDPTWQDAGGLPTYRTYWQAYSFGELSQLAIDRKEILAGLLPRLKIAKQLSLDGNFVAVKGKIRTYKIHIGSSNIMMEPNDQYLCIVEDRGYKASAVKLFLPFDGDNRLSLILSKIFLLAEDDKITDPVITGQINRQ